MLSGFDLYPRWVPLFQITLEILKNDTTLWVKAIGLLISLLNRCISIHSSELRTHWNICHYNNIPDIHTPLACPVVLNYKGQS